MGTDCDIRPARRVRKSRGGDELRRHLTTRRQALIELVINGHPSQPRLRDILPSTGMVWPFRTFLVGSSDAKIAAALRTVAPDLWESRLDFFFSQMFVAATKVLQQPATFPRIDSPVSLLTALHRNEYYSQQWSRTISGYHFTMLFLVIRAARENWFLTPQLPADINIHPCELARAIDKFNEVDTLDWSSAYIMQHLDWLRGRGGRILSMEIGSGEGPCHERLPGNPGRPSTSDAG